MDKDKAKGKDKPDEPRDSLREIAETVVFVVVLVLMLKTFVAEAFVIPTGSMAETLRGYHKIVTCDQCGHVFPVNCSSEVDPSNGVFSDIVGCTCPNCEFTMDWKIKQNGPSWGSGDRVLVAKFLFDNDHLWSPKRGQVFVFKYPGESREDSDDFRGGPQKGNTAMNYIKRCMGEPEETIAICGGDLYFTKGLKYPAPDRDPLDLWKKKYVHKNDAAALELFKESIKRREVGESLPGDFEIFRKPPPMSLAMRRIVFDNDHQPLDLKGKPEFRRWRAEGNVRWAGDSPEMPKSFTHVGSADQTGDAWLTYGHRRRHDHQPNMMQKPPPPNPPGFENDPRKLITNMMGYNTGRGDGNQDVTGSEWVGDLMLDCTVEVTTAEGEFVLELAKGPDRFQARFDVASGNCKLIRISGQGPESAAPVLAEKETKLKGTGTYHVRFANFDERLTVWVDRGLPFGDGVAYAPPKDRGPVGPNDLQPARVGAFRAGVAVSHLQLWRDSYYTVTDGGATVALAGDREEQILTMYVHAGHYLALGDNSAASADSRSWGLVPQRLLLGRALVVYSPFWPFVTQTRAGLIR